MRLLRGAEVVFDAEVEFEGADLKPETAAFIESGRFRDFRQAEKTTVERASLFFFAARHRKLDVVDGSGRRYVVTSIFVICHPEPPEPRSAKRDRRRTVEGPPTC